MALRPKSAALQPAMTRPPMPVARKSIDHVYRVPFGQGSNRCVATPTTGRPGLIDRNLIRVLGSHSIVSDVNFTGMPIIFERRREQPDPSDPGSTRSVRRAVALVTKLTPRQNDYLRAKMCADLCAGGGTRTLTPLGTGT